MEVKVFGYRGSVGIRGFWIQRDSWNKRLVDTDGQLKEEVFGYRGSVGRRGFWIERVSWNKRFVDTEGQLEEENGR